MDTPVWAPVSQHLQDFASKIQATKDSPENQGDFIPGEVVSVDYNAVTVNVKLEGRTESVGPFPYDSSLAVAVGGVVWFIRVGASLYGVAYRGSQWTTYSFPFTATVTNPVISGATNVGRYSVQSKICFFDLNLTWSPGDTVGNGGYRFGFPPALDVKGGGFPSGSAWMIGGGVDRGPTGWRLVSASTNATLLVYVPLAGGVDLKHNSYAWSSATPDIITITGWVPLN